MQERVNHLLERMVREKSLPKYVYKMREINRYLFDLLINAEMWLGSPKDFNDPFDCDLKTSIEGSTQIEINNYFHNHLYNLLNDEERASINENDISPLKFAHLLNQVFSRITQQKGVGCFLTNKNNLLMWAHYANSHKGVCLKFDIREAVDFFAPAKKVRYENNLPSYNYLNDRSKIIDLLFIKSKHWKYENEIRVIKDTPGVYQFPRTALKELVFGCNTPKGDVKTITAILKDKYPSTKIFQAQKKENRFGLDFIKLEI